MFIRRWCWPILIILIVLVIYVYVTECPSTDPHLVIEHEDTVAFGQLNNSFSDALTDTMCSSAENWWSGMLFHLGDYTEDCAGAYGGVQITLASGESMKLNISTRYWINIVSAHEINSDGCTGTFGECNQPMLPEEIVEIAPTTIQDAESCCWDTSDCQQGAPLHSGLRSIPHIITYWQGTNGYEFSGNYGAPPDGKFNSYEMVFGDEFEVWIYELGTAEDGSCTVELGGRHYDDVVEIRVLDGTPGPANGVRMDPAMP